MRFCRGKGDHGRHPFADRSWATLPAAFVFGDGFERAYPPQQSLARLGPGLSLRIRTIPSLDDTVAPLRNGPFGHGSVQA